MVQTVGGGKVWRERSEGAVLENVGYNLAEARIDVFERSSLSVLLSWEKNWVQQFF